MQPKKALDIIFSHTKFIIVDQRNSFRNEVQNWWLQMAQYAPNSLVLNLGTQVFDKLANEKDDHCLGQLY